MEDRRNNIEYNKRKLQGMNKSRYLLESTNVSNPDSPQGYAKEAYNDHSDSINDYGDTPFDGAGDSKYSRSKAPTNRRIIAYVRFSP